MLQMQTQQLIDIERKWNKNVFRMFMFKVLDQSLEKLHLPGRKWMGAQRFLYPQITWETRVLNTQGPLISARNKIPIFLPRKLGVDSVKHRMIFQLSEEADIIHLLLQMQTLPKFLRMIISDSSLPTPLPILRGNVTCNFLAC